MTHYITENGEVYGFKPNGVTVREMTSEEFQCFRNNQSSAPDLFTALRHARDARLDATDKYLLSDYPISESDLGAIKAYRQALRDLPAQPGAPWDGGGELTPWPELPSVG